MCYIYNGELGYRLERKEEKRRTTKLKKKKKRTQEGWERRKLKSHFLNDLWNKIRLGDNFGNKTQ